METIEEGQADTMTQQSLVAYGRSLCLKSMLWDLTSSVPQHAAPKLFYAINQEEMVDATLEELARIEARFIFNGLHTRALQCKSLQASLKMLWEEHGADELFSFYVRQGWNTEGRREPDIRMAMGLEILTGKPVLAYPPRWALRNDPLGRSYDKPIYRLLANKEYLHAFWNHGRLRISTLAACRGHEGLKGDTGEGSNMVWSVKDDGTTIATGYNVGDDAYVLCGTIANTPNNRKRFNAEQSGAIVINDPYRFALAVGGAIPHVIHGRGGYCDYRTGRNTHLADGTSLAEIHASIDFNSGNNIHRFREVAPGDEVFTKPKEGYEEEQEFRFAWYSGKAIIEKHVDIVCPEAREWCTIIWFDDGQ